MLGVAESCPPWAGLRAQGGSPWCLGPYIKTKLWILKPHRIFQQPHKHKHPDHTYTSTQQNIIKVSKCLHLIYNLPEGRYFSMAGVRQAGASGRGFGESLTGDTCSLLYTTNINTKLQTPSMLTSDSGP